MCQSAGRERLQHPEVRGHAARTSGRHHWNPASAIPARQNCRRSGCGDQGTCDRTFHQPGAAVRQTSGRRRWSAVCLSGGPGFAPVQRLHPMCFPVAASPRGNVGHLSMPDCGARNPADRAWKGSLGQRPSAATQRRECPPPLSIPPRLLNARLAIGCRQLWQQWPETPRAAGHPKTVWHCP